MINPKRSASGTKTHYLTKTSGKTGKKVWERLGLDQHLTPYTKINSEWMNDLNIKKETISKLGEHRIVYLSDIWKGKTLKPSKLEKITKSKINNFDYIKLKSFCTNKTNETKIKREARHLGKKITTKTLTKV